jgi:hypothetical protein
VYRARRTNLNLVVDKLRLSAEYADKESSMPLVKLVTKAQWDKLLPRSQGYVLYRQGGIYGSEL